jgi:REP element-mobilizing transposase RayT
MRINSRLQQRKVRLRGLIAAIVSNPTVSMPNRSSHAELYLHLVWATWDRHPFLADPELRRRVYACLLAECTRMGADLLAVGGVEDHVHVLVRPPATIAPASLVKQMKGASSHLVNEVIRPPFFFKWQGGYGAFSVSRRHVPFIRRYIERQEDHHRERRLFDVLELPSHGDRR